MALWDIKGKALNVPVYELLGGKTNNKLRAYASQIQFGWSKDFLYLATPEQYAEAALQAVAEGYTAVKVDPFQVDNDGNYQPHNFGLLTNVLTPDRERKDQSLHKYSSVQRQFETHQR